MRQKARGCFGMMGKEALVEVRSGAHEESLGLFRTLPSSIDDKRRGTGGSSVFSDNSAFKSERRLYIMFLEAETLK